jgi:hypothetical protein
LLFSCCNTVAALALANCNEHVAEKNISRPHPPTPSLSARALPAFPVSRAKLRHGISYVSPLLLALFLSRTPRLQAVSTREIVQMQAG